jgi:hypothetical protein
MTELDQIKEGDLNLDQINEAAQAFTIKNTSLNVS